MITVGLSVSAPRVSPMISGSEHDNSPFSSAKSGRKVRSANIDAQSVVSPPMILVNTFFTLVAAVSGKYLLKIVFPATAYLHVRTHVFSRSITRTVLSAAWAKVQASLKPFDIWMIWFPTKPLPKTGLARLERSWAFSGARAGKAAVCRMKRAGKTSSFIAPISFLEVD